MVWLFYDQAEVQAPAVFLVVNPVGVAEIVFIKNIDGIFRPAAAAINIGDADRAEFGNDQRDVVFLGER